MNFESALIIFAFKLMDNTSSYPYDTNIVTKTACAVSKVTNNPQEAETLIKIARWESGGFRPEVATCKIKGDHGLAHGLFQVHPWSKEEAKKLCSNDFVEQAHVALSRVRMSVNMCKRMGKRGSDLLTGYTVGHCISQGKAAALRWGTGKTLMKLLK